METKIAVQRLFRGILLRTPSSSEEKLFTQLFDSRSLTEEQLAVLGWQSSEFLGKVAPIALLDYALSGMVNGQRVIGWYNSPSGNPLAPSGSDATLNALQVMLSGYGLIPARETETLTPWIQQIALRLGFSLSRTEATGLAEQVVDGTVNLVTLVRDAVNLTASQRPQLMNAVAGALLESVLSEDTVAPSGTVMAPIDLAQGITDTFLTPTLSLSSGIDLIAYESTSNDGSLPTVTLDLVGANWRAKTGETIVVLGSLPTGLTGKVVVTGAQTAEIRFSGKAKAHDEASSKSIKITFSDTHFLGAKAADIAPLSKGTLTLDLQFFDDEPWTISGSRISLIGNSETRIDLDTRTGSVGSYSLDTSELGPIKEIDARAVTATGIFLGGDADNNILRAGAGGSTLRGRGGADTLYGGNGIDTIVFEAISSLDSSGITGNGLDTLYDFRVGEGGDVLDFRAFLGKPSSAAITPISAAAGSPTAWSNGNVLVVHENGGTLNTPAEIATLFGSALAAPSGPARVVLITAGVPAPDNPGLAHIWFISNRSAAGSVSVIESAEIVEVAQLVGINNLTLNSLLAENILT